MQRVVTLDELAEDLAALKVTMDRIGVGHHWPLQLDTFTKVTIPLVKNHLEQWSPTQVVA